MSTPYFALDLTPATAPHSWLRSGDAETESFILSRLAGLAAVADKASFDLITIGGAFRLGGGRRRDEWLDAALASTRLGHHTESLTIAAGIPLGISHHDNVAAAVQSVHKATRSRAAWQVEAVELSSLNPGAVAAVIAQLVSTNSRTGARGTRPQIVVPVRQESDIEIAGSHASVARIAAESAEEAISLRNRIRKAAEAAGRAADDVTVLVDTHVILSEDAVSAQARFELFQAVEGSPQPPSLTIIGTPADAAATINEWIAGGAADGAIFIPTSVPTDVLSVARHVVPQVRQLAVTRHALV